MPAADLGGLAGRVVLLEDGDDLRLAEADFFTKRSPFQALCLGDHNFIWTGNRGLDQPVIYDVRFSPTLLSYGTPVQFSVITSTNIARLTLSYNGVSTSLAQTGAGNWQGRFPFTLIGTPGPIGPITLTLSASKADGTATAISIPVTVAVQGNVGTSAQGDLQESLPKPSFHKGLRPGFPRISRTAPWRRQSRTFYRG